MLTKKKVIYISINDIKTLGKNQFHNFFKKSIFEGQIIIIRANPHILRICKWIRADMNANLSKHILSDDLKKLKKDFYNLKELKIYQKKIKNDFQLKNNFTYFLKSLGFFINETFLDEICLRVTSPRKTINPGILPKAGAHRDTWGSNLKEQINWWFPIKNIKNSNSIYFVPVYYDKFISNTSAVWDYSKYKKNPKKFSSTPVINDTKLIENKKFTIKPKMGDIVCFSGHHLHGSGCGDFFRMNIETRSISLRDNKNFKVPETFDYSKKIQKRLKWFKNIQSDRCLSFFYK